MARDTHTPPAASAGPPLPYPTGWFAIACSGEIPPGRVLTRTFMNEEVVLYRTRGGRLRAVQPHCPHLGAHLGHGGTVKGEHLICPFHRFAFATDGTCTATGYGTQPPRISLTALPLHEVNDIVFIGYEQDGSAPAWQIPDLSGPPQRPYCRPVHHTFTLAGHPQEVCENAVDSGHLAALHGFTVLQPPENDLVYHDTWFTYTMRVGRRVPLLGEVHLTPRIHVYGVSGIRADLPLPAGLGRLRMWVLPIATGPWHIEIRLPISAALPALRFLPPALRAPVGERLARLLARLYKPLLKWDIGSDVPIWNHKRYIDPPRLARGDGPIGTYRKWARQFLSAPSGTPNSSQGEERLHRSSRPDQERLLNDQDHP
nr:Rieske 2Fe-2S domain-containing protein [Nocardiopsis mwathae]